jgi:ribose transport system substrate-binding protein
MKKIILAAAGIFMLVSALFAGPNSQGTGSASGKKQIAVIIRATDSEFWQSLNEGAKKFAAEHASEIEITYYGAPTEAHIAEFTAILEDVIAKKPDAIVATPPNADSIVPAANNAAKLGIPLIVCDNNINTKTTAHIATDNIVGGAAVADALVAALNAKGKALRGTIAIIGPGVFEVINNRVKGFTDRLKVIAPNIKTLAPQYCDNDIAKSLNIAQNLMLSTPDLIGFYGANNHSADGIARAIRESGKKDAFISVAYDSDPEEVTALADGILSALIVQDPWALGYLGCQFALDAINGKPVPPYTNPGVATVTTTNMNEPAAKAILDPKLRQKLK